MRRERGNSKRKQEREGNMEKEGEGEDISTNLNKSLFDSICGQKLRERRELHSCHFI